jgi:hypothetical protein
MIKDQLEILKAVKAIKESGPVGNANKFLLEIDSRLQFTEFEIKDEPEEIKEYIRKNGYLVTAIEKYGFTDPYQLFEYNHTRLSKYISIVTYVLINYKDVADSDFVSVSEDLGYDNTDDGWKDFLNDIKLFRNIFIYEHSLINLMTIFESYINHILLFIYKNDPQKHSTIEVKLSYEQIINNLENLVDLILNEHINSLYSWKERIEAIKHTNLKINLNEHPEMPIIREAIERRNTLIHNLGRVNKNYNKRIGQSLEIDTPLIVDKDYYNKVNAAVLSIVNKLESNLKNKFL